MKISIKSVTTSLRISYKHFKRLCKLLKLDCPKTFSYRDLDEMSKLLKEKDTYRANCLVIKLDNLKASL